MVVKNKWSDNMTLTKDKVKSLFDKNYTKQNDISKRFDNIGKICDDFSKLDIADIYIKEFGPLIDGLLGQNGSGNREHMKETINLIDELWFLIGGFDGKKIQAKYRIISSSRGSKENYSENEDYSTSGQSLWANSNFVTNNYPHQIAKFLQDIASNKSFEEAILNSKIVLTWRTTSYLGNDENNFFEASKERLKKRFPPKFLWMWAKKDEVIHPISLMAFRNFLNSEYGQSILTEVDKNYTPESITNMSFDDFKVAWKNISDKISGDLVEDFEQKKDEEKWNIINEISLLISQICIEETDIKNISDLLQTGNKAVILWGPPGTGKTYESEQVVKELLEIDQDENIEDYLFSKNKINLSTNDKGYYEIIQFHPNYTYQDFIGGIAPSLGNKIKSDTISYELREGIFKRFCDKAKQNKNQQFIFIIDEINRAELSAVFGELLYALEYRDKSINLPYFDEFSIPSNVYIIGTMNNVDKSLVTFDLALRRRFGFFKLMPKLEVINEVLSELVEDKSLENYYNKCINLNKAIETKLELGKDYQIGQAYFLKIKDFLEQKKSDQIISSFELEKLWVYNIEPLLEEYLGMGMEDENIQAKLNNLQKEFVEN